MLPFVGPVPAHIVGWLIALVFGGGTAAWLMVRAGMSDRAIVMSLLPRIAALFVGSKLLYLVEDWQRWWGDPRAFLDAFFSEQMRIPGGLVLMVIVGAVVSRAIAVRPLFLTDTIAPAAGLVIFGIRVGCFLEGCCYGYPTSLPWGVAFPSRSPSFLWQLQQGVIQAGDAARPVHPLQLYFALAGVLIFVGLAVYQPHKRYAGEVLLLLGLSYLWSTWLLEFLRARPHALTQQVVLVGAVGLTAFAAIVEQRRRRSRTNPRRNSLPV